MENFGKIKAIQAKKFEKSFLNESSNDITSLSDYLTTIRNSQKLQREFEIYKSLEKAYIPKETLAMKHIDRTIGSGKGMLVESELNKIQKFAEDIEIEPEKEKLYESIHTLLYGSNPDKIHESYVTVLEHIMNNEPINESNEIKYPENVDRNVILELAVKKFNEKYSSMNEGDRKLFKLLLKSDDQKKKELFESLKQETLELTTNGDNNGFEDKVHEAIDKISKLEYDKSTVVENIIKLNNFKEYLSD
jgi:hypothetical protein